MTSSIVDIVKRNAEREPSGHAIAAPGLAPLTHARLLRSISDTGEALKSVGVSPADRVAIVLPNGPCLATAFLGVASCAAAAPLNPAYQEKEFEFYLTDSKSVALITERDERSPGRRIAQEVARAKGLSIFELEPSREEAGVFALAPVLKSPSRALALTTQEAALVLHTSGTTSRPKLVPLTAANLLASAANVAAALRLDAKDRCLNVMPLFHIHGLVAAVLSSLTSGGTVICTGGPAFPAFFEWLEKLSPTWYTAVPTIHQAVLDFARAQRITPRHRLRHVRSSSAALPGPTLQGLEALFAAPVVEAYGMTEAAHQMASNPLPPGRRKPGSVGVAAGPRVAIMDGAGTLLSSGERGEVVIQGPNVTKGYEGNAEANRTAFTRGWFRTGDLGYLDREGYLFLAGRIKEIINRAGEKVSPREVDEALLEHPAISLAVAFAIPHPTLGEDVAAAVVLKEKAQATERELREFLSGRLAAFKVPQRIVFLKELPKGPTGKLQRIGLHERLQDALAPPRSGSAAPGNETERWLADIWCEVLGLDHVGVDDNFFSLGGDSLHGMRVIVKAHERGLVIEPQMLFRTPTIAELAKAAGSRVGATPAPPPAPDLGPARCELLGITPERRSRLERKYDAIEGAYPILPGQLALCSTERKPDRASFGWVGELELTVAGVYQEALFREAWERAVRSHPATRAAFDWGAELTPVKVVCREAPLLWDYRDLRGTSADLVPRIVEEMKARERDEGFEPGRPPHLRIAAFQTELGMGLLLSHWMPSLDTWSALNLLREALATYRKAERGESAPVSVDAYAEYVESRTRPRSHDEAAGRRWESAFDSLVLPDPAPWAAKAGRLFAPRAASRSTHGIALSDEETRTIRAWARGRKLHLNAVLQGAFTHELARLAPGADLVMLHTVSGRFDAFPGVESLVGSTFEAFPIRVRPDAQAAPLDRIAFIQRELMTPATGDAWKSPLERAGMRIESLPIWHYASLPELGIAEVRELRGRLFHAETPLLVTVVPEPRVEVTLTGTIEESLVSRLLAGFRDTVVGLPRLTTPALR